MAPSRQADNRNVFLWFQDLATYVSWSVSRPSEVQPWEVRFAHPCRARARHPIHKAMGGHASHDHTSDRAFIQFQFRERTLKHYGRAHLYPVCFSIPLWVQLEHLRVCRYHCCSYEKSTNFSYPIFCFTYRSFLLSIDSFHQFVWCKYLHL